MKANLNINQGNVVEAAKASAKITANEYVIHSKFGRGNWNGEPADFYSNQKLIGHQNNEVGAMVDEVAKQIRKLTHYSPHTLKQFPNPAHSAAHPHGADESMSDGKGLSATYRPILGHHKFLSSILSVHSF